MSNTTLIKTILRNTVAEGIYKEITNRSGRYYYYLGRTLAWDDELNPLVPVDSITYTNTSRNEIISMKEITPSDVSFVVPRYEWDLTGKTIYDQYDDQYSTEVQGVNLKNGGIEFESAPYVYIGSTGYISYTISTAYTVGQLLKSGNNYYIVTVAGTSGITAPTHTSGTAILGGVSLMAVAVNDANGSSATAISSLTDGVVTNIEITSKGIGYTSSPSVIIAGSVTDISWIASSVVTLNQKMTYQGNIYIVTHAGTTGTSPPIHTSSIITGGDFVPTTQYTILTLGDTNWYAIGASLTPTVGEIFVASGIGSGTGTARPSVVNGTAKLRWVAPHVPADGISVVTIGPKSGKQKIEDCHFYTITEDHNVYICLDNNNGAKSTQKPVDTDFAPFEYSDGYVWKFMYNVPIGLRNKFLTDTYVPVVTAMQNQFYSNGNIQFVRVDQAGTGYTGAVISIIGDGHLEENPLYLTGIDILDHGSQFTSPTVVIDPPFNNVVPWSIGYVSVIGQKYSSNNNIYEVAVSGTFGPVAPMHKYGIVANGTAALKYIGTTATATAIANDGRTDLAVGPSHSGIVSNGTAALAWNGTRLNVNPIFTEWSNWTAATLVVLGEQIVSGAHLYVVTIAGTTDASTAPNHITGIATNGTATLEYDGTREVVNPNINTWSAWVANTAVILDQHISYNDNLYVVTIPGTTDIAIPPSHSVGDVANGDATLRWYGLTSTVEPPITSWEHDTPVTIGQQVAYKLNLYTVTTAGTTNLTVPPTHISDGTNGSAILTWDGYRSTVVSSIDIWVPSTVVTTGQQLVSGLNIYMVTDSGTTGTVAPTHTSGAVIDGAELTWDGYRLTDSSPLGIDTWTPSTVVINGHQITYSNNTYRVTSVGVIDSITLNQNVREVTIKTNGGGYSAPPPIIFTPHAAGPGTGAQAFAILSNGSISRIIITDSGKDYVLPPDIQIGTKWSANTAVASQQQLFYDTNLYTVTAARGIVGESTAFNTAIGTTTTGAGKFIRNSDGIVVGVVESVTDNTNIVMDANGTVPISSGTYLISTPKITAGTISTVAGSTVVTGTSTAFLTEIGSGTYGAGTILYTSAGVLIGTVSNVSNNSSLTLLKSSPISVTLNDYYIDPTSGSGSITCTTAANTIIGVGANFTKQIGSLVAGAGTVVRNSAGVVVGVVSSVTDDTHLTLVSNAAIDVTAGIYFITLTGHPGTITSTTGSTAVVGVGTEFTTEIGSGISGTGTVLYNSSGAIIGIVSSVTDDTHLTLKVNGAVAVTNGKYFIVRTTRTGTITATVISTAVVGSGTAFLTSIGATTTGAGTKLYNSSGVLVGVVASVTDDTHLTLVSNAAVAVTAGSYFIAPVGTTGTITATVISTAVVGVNTLFLTQMTTGSIIYNATGSTIGIVASITDDTHLTLTNNAVTAITAAKYFIRPTHESGIITASTGSTTVIGVGTAFTKQIATGTIIYNSIRELVGIVSSVTDNTHLILTTNARVAVSSEKYYISLSVNGVGTITAPVGITDASIPPTHSTVATNAGGFVPGQSYTIATLGTTDFIAIGAQANVVGLSFNATGAGSGTGTARPSVANGTAQLTYVGEEAVATAYIKCGAGYSSQPSTTILGSPNHDAITQFISSKSNAILIPIIEGGQLTSVQIDDGGVGYTYATLTVSGDGTDAVATAQLSIGDANSLQANVELLSVDGSINNIPVISGGFGYTTATVTIIGDGTGTEATAHIIDGVINKINITHVGKNYRWATATITGDGSGAKLRVIISPYGGHGKEALNNLFARTLMFYTNISGDRNQGFEVKNDYRQLGVLKNPRKYNSTYSLTGASASACWVISSGDSISELIYPIDSLIYLNFGLPTQSRFRIVSHSGAALLIQSLDNGIPELNSTINNGLGATFIITTITPPTIDKYSGDLLYIDNKQAFIPSEDQIVSLRTVLKF